MLLADYAELALFDTSPKIGKGLRRRLVSLLPETLADLFGATSADAVEAKTKYESVFLSHANIEGVVLCRYRATVPGVANRHSGANERAAVSSWSLLKVEEEGGA